MLRFLFVLVSTMIPSNPIHLELKRVDNAGLLPQTAALIARWEHHQLALGKVAFAEGSFIGRDPYAAAQACDRRKTGCEEGVTIGFGYNLGAQRPAEVERALTPIVGKARAHQIKRCAGFLGVKAYKACHHKPWLRLNRAEAYALLEHRLQYDLDAVEHEADKQDVKLLPNQKAALVSVHYTSPRLIKKAPMLWAAIKRGDLDKAADEIALRSGSKLNPGLTKRRQKEAEIFLDTRWVKEPWVLVVTI